MRTLRLGARKARKAHARGFEGPSEWTEGCESDRPTHWPQSQPDALKLRANRRLAGVSLARMSVESAYGAASADLPRGVTISFSVVFLCARIRADIAPAGRAATGLRGSSNLMRQNETFQHTWPRSVILAGGGAACAADAALITGNAPEAIACGARESHRIRTLWRRANGITLKGRCAKHMMKQIAQRGRNGAECAEQSLRGILLASSRHAARLHLFAMRTSAVGKPFNAARQ